MWSDGHKGDIADRPLARPLTCPLARPHIPASVTVAMALVALVFAWCLAPMAHADELTAAQPTDIGAGKLAGKTTWPDFRGSPTNNAVTSAPTPRTAAEAGLIWALKLDGGYMSPCILVDDALVVTVSNGLIYKLDKDTGAVLAKGTMSGSTGFSLMPPTYADGKIFVTLSGGGMQAFDSSSLEPLWIHRDELGGQGNCQVAYSDGRVYTGYWSGEEADASFVCLDAETGELLWKQQNKGGYYWVGAVAVGDYLVFGCDDGEKNEAGTSHVRCVDKESGREVSSVAVSGDQRSSIAYEPSLGRLYFTAKPGLLYSVRIDAKTGTLTDCKSLQVDVECVSTPLVHDGRVYVGTSEGGFAKGGLSVVDASNLALLYRLDSSSGIPASVKSAPLMSTAYRGDGADGRLYLYFTCNYRPGGITALEVAPGSENANQARALELFKPPDAMQQFSISSVICDGSGHLYYRNDSNYLMCIGPEGTPPADYVGPSDPEPSPWDPPSDDDPEQPGNADAESGNTENGAGQGSTGGSSAYQQQRGGGTITTTGSTGATRTTVAPQTRTPSTSNPAGSTATTTGSSGTATGRPGVASASDGNRHTDTEAATLHLDAANSQDSNREWLTPAAVVMGLALAALIALAIARGVAARKHAPAGIDADELAIDFEGEDGFTHA